MLTNPWPPFVSRPRTRSAPARLRVACAAASGTGSRRSCRTASSWHGLTRPTGRGHACPRRARARGRAGGGRACPSPLALVHGRRGDRPRRPLPCPPLGRDRRLDRGCRGGPRETDPAVRPLQLYSDYTRREVHAVFAPGTPFTPKAGTWGILGIVPVPDRPKDYVFFVTFGRSQGEHTFDEGITEWRCAHVAVAAEDGVR